MNKTNISDKQINYLAKIPDDILPLVPIFLAKREAELIELRNRLTTNDFDYIRMVGHRLAGTGASYGMAEFSLLGRNLEFAARANDSEKILHTLDELELQITSVKRDLTAS